MIEKMLTDKQLRLLTSYGDGNFFLGLQKIVIEFERKKKTNRLDVIKEYDAATDAITKLDWGSDASEWKWRTATEALQICGVRNPTRAQCAKAGIVIREKNHGQAKRGTGRSLLLVPVKIVT